MIIGHFVGIGSNIGAKIHVSQAIRGLLAISPELTLSRVLTNSTHRDRQQIAVPQCGRISAERSECPEQLKQHLNMVEGQLGRDRSDPERGKKDRAIDLDVLLSMPPDLAEIRDEQVSVETYYRPQMLELIHALGFDCCISAETDGRCGRDRIRRMPGRFTSCPDRLSWRGHAGGDIMSAVTERKAALVTGGAVRLGRAIAISLAAAGFDIALHYNRSEAQALTAAADIRDRGVRCELFQHDLCQIHHLDSMIASVASKFPGSMFWSIAHQPTKPGPSATPRRSNSTGYGRSTSRRRFS